MKYEFKSMSDEEIYDVFISSIKKIYKSFEYSGISREKFDNLVFKEISKLKNSNVTNQSFSSSLTKNIKNRMKEYVEELIKDPEFTCFIIGNYINDHFRGIITYQDSILCFKKLNKFFKECKYTIDIDVFTTLLNNNAMFKQLLELVFNKYADEITSGKYESIFDNDLLISLIELYCMINNIEIKQTLDLSVSPNMTQDDDFDLVKIYIKEVKFKKLLSINEEKELLQKISTGDKKARKKFIESNLPLVMSIAKSYMNRGVSYIDLIQEGNIGLMQAVDRFDVTKGFKFSTYATWWIRQAVTRTLSNDSRNIRIPVYMFEKINQYNKIVSKLESKLNRTPTDEEIMNEMKISLNQLKSIQMYQNDTISLNTPTGEDNDTELGAYIVSDDKTPDEQYFDKLNNNLIIKLFDECKLNERERYIIIHRCGLFGQDEMRLEEIGKKYNVTRERIRQLEYKIKRKLAQGIKANPQDFLECLPKYLIDSCEKAHKNNKPNTSKPVLYKQKINQTQANKFLDRFGLTDFEKYVLSHRYGLFNSSRMTIDEMAQKFNVTDEDVLSVEANAFAKIENTSASNLEMQNVKEIVCKKK